MCWFPGVLLHPARGRVQHSMLFSSRLGFWAAVPFTLTLGTFPRPLGNSGLMTSTLRFHKSMLLRTDHNYFYKLGKLFFSLCTYEIVFLYMYVNAMGSILPVCVKNITAGPSPIAASLPDYTGGHVRTKDPIVFILWAPNLRQFSIM